MRFLRSSLAGLTLVLTIQTSLAADPAKDPKVVAQTDLQSLDLAVTAYEIDTGAFPSMAQGLKALVEKPNGVAGWRGPYVKALRNDPWNKPYMYRVPGKGKRPYELFSTGPDGRERGGDDIKLIP